MVARNIDDLLVAVDGPHIDRYKPVLATSWESNADKSVWTFHLRHGVPFHTGRCCMTAQDVQWSLARLMKANLTNAYLFARFLSNPDKQIVAVDPYTVRFILNKPSPIFLGAVAQEYAALILDSQALKAHLGKDLGHTYATDHDLGTGPYMIQNWQHGQQITLVRFPAYWGGWSGPHFSTVIEKSVAEDTTRRELVEKGQADITYDLTPQDYQALAHESSVKLDIHYGTEIDFITMTEAGPLASPLARQALSYAFNYDALVHGFYRGYAQRGYGPLASTLLGYDPQMFHYQTDLNKAKALLRQAGVGAGTTLSIAYEDPYGPAAQILAAQLAQIGITLKIQHLDTSAFNSLYFSTTPANKRPNLITYAWWPDYNDPYDESYILVASASGGANGANAGFYHNKAVDALLNDMQNADRQTLIADSKKLQDITSRQDPPAIWTAEPAQVTVMARSLQGYVFNPLELRTYYFYDLHR